ncbi:MAG: hypothetical protein PHR39_07095, partial [Actinomycetota bacterium]|nr:hypothetical protein [Actinomycetota bacterium]
MHKNKIKSLIFLTFSIFFIMELLFSNKIFAEEKKIWIDTSHWEVQDVFISDGYWETKENKRWVDTSYKVNQGYWSNESHM